MRLLEVLQGEASWPPPIWMMRQAGRYLPEYREIRKKASSFLDFCYSVDLATEATLQPIRRYQFDGSILFSDILVVPDAMGMDVRFVSGEGPKLVPLTSREDIEALSTDDIMLKLDVVCENVRSIRAGLPAETTLLGFAGAPWTLAAYMIEGQGSRDYAVARVFAYQHPEAFKLLIDKLVVAISRFLSEQIKAGANAVQLFDSWSGVLAPEEFVRWVIAPTRDIIERLKAEHPSTPVITFPRGVGLNLSTFVRETGAKAISIDTSMPMDEVIDALPVDIVLQGNLDPLVLVAGGQIQQAAVGNLLKTMKSAKRPYIFNLGHGIVPQVDPVHVTDLVRQVRTG